MLNIVEKGYTFDDVLLLPAYSEVLPKEVNVTSRLTKNISINSPIASAAMDTVTESRLAIALAEEGGVGIIHKNMSPQEQAHQVANVKNHQVDKNCSRYCVDSIGRLRVGAAVGIGAEERVKLLQEAAVDVIVVDTAHGHSRGVIDQVKWIKDHYPDMEVIAGNIATAEAALALLKAGADAVKVGIGPGSICTTRIVAGVGVPQLSAISNVVCALKGSGIPVIADGGIRYSGDLVKAIAAGASAVMLGSIFASTIEAPGDVEVINGKSYKVYRGMGSLGAMSKGSADRYFQENGLAQDKFVPEGIEGMVICRGSVAAVMHQMLGGLKSAMGYLGSRDISILHNSAKFVEITGSGILESHAHDILQIKSAPNYIVE